MYIYIYNHNGFFAPQFHERKYQLPSTPLTCLNAPPTLLTRLLTEFILYININSVRRWNGPGQLEVPPQSSLSYFRAIGATTSPVRTYCSR